MSFSRRILTEIFINSKNITRNLENYLTAVSISDVLDGEACTAEIELQDAEKIWLSDWFPSRGDTCKLAFTLQNWQGDNAVESVDFDFFEIDEVSINFPPSTCKIKMTSISGGSDLKSADKSRSWEQVKLSKICSDIAADASHELFYDTNIDPDISRAEQKNESNLAFLHKLCKNHGLILRVSDNKLIIADEQKLENQDSVMTFKVGDAKIISFSGSATLSEIYSSAEVEYSHGKKKEKITGKFEDKSRGNGKTLKIKKKVSSQGEADNLAKKELRDKNKKEIQVRLSCIGNCAFLAGNVVELDKSFGFFAGNYIVERATWKIGSGFTCNLDLRKCLGGY